MIADLGGAVLGGVFGALARLRGTRALHPVGVCGAGMLTVVPGPVSGVPLLDVAGPHPCQVRWSRATGFRVGPDIEGIALRVGGPAAGDVLLASTRTGVVGRHVLAPRWRRDYGTVSTLLPLETALGSVLLRLDPVAEPGEEGGDGESCPPTAYRMQVAAPGRPWRERGRLEIDWADGDCTRRHDPVGHPPVGTWVHPFWARLREPAYARSTRVPARVESAG